MSVKIEEKEITIVQTKNVNTVHCDFIGCTNSEIMKESYIGPKGWERYSFRKGFFDLCPECSTKVFEYIRDE